MIELTVGQVKNILKRMESKRVSFIEFQSNMASDDIGNSWDVISIVGYSEDRKNLGIIMEIETE